MKKYILFSFFLAFMISCVSPAFAAIMHLSDTAYALLFGARRDGESEKNLIYNDADAVCSSREGYFRVKPHPNLTCDSKAVNIQIHSVDSDGNASSADGTKRAYCYTNCRCDADKFPYTVAGLTEYFVVAEGAETCVEIDGTQKVSAIACNPDNALDETNIAKIKSYLNLNDAKNEINDIVCYAKNKLECASGVELKQSDANNIVRIVQNGGASYLVKFVRDPSQYQIVLNKTIPSDYIKKSMLHGTVLVKRPIPYDIGCITDANMSVLPDSKIYLGLPTSNSGVSIIDMSELDIGDDGGLLRNQSCSVIASTPHKKYPSASFSYHTGDCKEADNCVSPNDTTGKGDCAIFSTESGDAYNPDNPSSKSSYSCNIISAYIGTGDTILKDSRGNYCIPPEKYHIKNYSEGFDATLITRGDSQVIRVSGCNEANGYSLYSQGSSEGSEHALAMKNLLARENGAYITDTIKTTGSTTDYEYMICRKSRVCFDARSKEDENGECVCYIKGTENMDEHAVYNESTQKCECLSGYKMKNDNTQCIPQTCEELNPDWQTEVINNQICEEFKAPNGNICYQNCVTSICGTGYYEAGTKSILDYETDEFIGVMQVTDGVSTPYNIYVDSDAGSFTHNDYVNGLNDLNTNTTNFTGLISDTISVMVKTSKYGNTSFWASNGCYENGGYLFYGNSGELKCLVKTTDAEKLIYLTPCTCPSGMTSGSQDVEMSGFDNNKYTYCCGPNLTWDTSSPNGGCTVCTDNDGVVDPNAVYNAEDGTCGCKEYYEKDSATGKCRVADCMAYGDNYRNDLPDNNICEREWTSVSGGLCYCYKDCVNSICGTGYYDTTDKYVKASGTGEFMGVKIGYDYYNVYVHSLGAYPYSTHEDKLSSINTGRYRAVNAGNLSIISKQSQYKDITFWGDGSGCSESSGMLYYSKDGTTQCQYHQTPVTSLVYLTPCICPAGADYDSDDVSASTFSNCSVGSYYQGSGNNCTSVYSNNYIVSQINTTEMVAGTVASGSQTTTSDAWEGFRAKADNACKAEGYTGIFSGYLENLIDLDTFFTKNNFSSCFVTAAGIYGPNIPNKKFQGTIGSDTINNSLSSCKSGSGISARLVCQKSFAKKTVASTKTSCPTATCEMYNLKAAPEGLCKERVTPTEGLTCYKDCKANYSCTSGYYGSDNVVRDADKKAVGIIYNDRYYQLRASNPGSYNYAAAEQFVNGSSGVIMPTEDMKDLLIAAGYCGTANVWVKGTTTTCPTGEQPICQGGKVSCASATGSALYKLQLYNCGLI